MNSAITNKLHKLIILKKNDIFLTDMIRFFAKFIKKFKKM